MATDWSNAMASKPRDDVFYFNFITFEVEGVLFRVSRYPFELGSDVFKGMFLLPATDEMEEGASDEKPVILPGVSAKDFRALLRVFFDTPYIQQSDLSQEEWASVLELSHFWHFDQTFALAIQKLDQLTRDPVERIVLATSYGISDWLRPAYFELAVRPEPPTLEEVKKLSIETILKFAKVRERRYRWIIDNEDFRYSHYRSGYVYPEDDVVKGMGSRSCLLDTRPGSNSPGEDLINRHNTAIHAALTDVFGLE